MDKEKILRGIGGFLGIFVGGAIAPVMFGNDPEYWAVPTFIGCGVGIWIGGSIGREWDIKGTNKPLISWKFDDKVTNFFGKIIRPFKIEKINRILLNLEPKKPLGKITMALLCIILIIVVFRYIWVMDLRDVVMGR